MEQAKVWALDTLQQKFGVDLSNSEIAALVYKVPAEGGELRGKRLACFASCLQGTPRGTQGRPQRKLASGAPNRNSPATRGGAWRRQRCP